MTEELHQGRVLLEVMMTIFYEGERLEVRSEKKMRFLVRGGSGRDETKSHAPQIREGKVGKGYLREVSELQMRDGLESVALQGEENIVGKVFPR